MSISFGKPRRPEFFPELSGIFGAEIDTEFEFCLKVKLFFSLGVHFDLQNPNQIFPVAVPGKPIIRKS